MAYNDIIKQIPFEAKQKDAKGILPPIIRAISHIVYVAALTADEDRDFNSAEAKTELEHAHEHWNAIAAGNENLSDGTRTNLVIYGLALRAAIDEYDEWDHATRIKSIKDLAQRVAAMSATLDREFVGLTDSDAGTSL